MNGGGHNFKDVGQFRYGQAAQKKSIAAQLAEGLIDLTVNC